MRYSLNNPFSDRLNKAISISKQQPFYLRYTLPVFSSILVILLKLGLDPVIGKGTPFLLLLPAILLSTWFGGVGPGLVAAILTTLGALYYFLPPYNSFVITNVSISVSELALFLLESGIVIYIIYRRNKTYEEMQLRTAQQAVVATIGQYGLEEHDLKVFLNRVVRAIAKTLNVEFVKVLELMPDQKNLRVISGVGWKRGVVGKTLVEASQASHAGYTLIANKPVITTDLHTEKRFVGMNILHEHNITSGMSVVVSGAPKPFGILTVHTQGKRKFTKDDVHFMSSLANVIATTIQRRADKQDLELLTHINTALVSSLDPKETLSSVVKTLVPQFADICEVYIKQSEDQVDLIEVKGVTKEKERLFREIGRSFPPVPGSKRPSAQVLQSGRPVFIPYVPPTYHKDIATDTKHEQLARQLKLQSIMVLPIKIRHKTIGVLGFGTVDHGRIYTEREYALAKEIADRVAVAVDNALLYQEARLAVQARDEFLSIASHELKTPLTSMLLQLQTVLHSIKSDSLANFSIERTMKMLESTISQSKRLSKLISDLLNVSLITTGRLELEKEKTDLAKIVKEVSERLQNQAEKSGSHITMDLPKAVVGHWDKIRIEQVVTNLLTNAIKYGNGKDIAISLSTSNQKAVLVVRDKGLGIPKDQQEKIFQRFQRGKVDGAIKGLGVGLYLVNEIIKAHSGKIELTSNPKEGSTFTVTLPQS